MAFWISQEGSGRPTYMFERSWGVSGGALNGDNFISDICIKSCVGDRNCVKVYSEDNVWKISSLKTDPDYLCYLWKRGRGEPFHMYVSEDELIFLYGFYKLNGFNFMLEELKIATERINNVKKCILF